MLSGGIGLTLFHFYYILELTLTYRMRYIVYLKSPTHTYKSVQAGIKAKRWLVNWFSIPQIPKTLRYTVVHRVCRSVHDTEGNTIRQSADG